jgi:aerobic carbon-monoxide dehydrogenase large subunit
MTTTAGRFVGQSVKRREDPRLLTGHGHYVDDVVVPGMLHAAFVRSDHARARITRLDVEAALALPGVHAVLTGADLNPGRGSIQPTMFSGDNPPSPNAPVQPLADGDVRFVGDPIAIVVAESRYVAEDACELIEVDFEPFPPIIDPEVAVTETEQLVHPELGSNIAMQVPSPPDPELDHVFETAAHVVRETFHQHRHTNVPMETRGVVAGYEPSTGELDVWIST